MAYMTLNEYARHKGVEGHTVKYHIDRGNITARKDGNTWKIDPAKADAQWDAIQNPLNHKTKERLKKEGKPVVSVDEDSPIPETSDHPTTRAAAAIEKEFYTANIKRLQFEKMNGTLIEKDAVYSALFETAKGIRLVFEALPDRVIDQIQAAPSRHEALNVLKNAINEALVNVVERVEKIDFEATE
jgi:hypothetical protein